MQRTSIDRHKKGLTRSWCLTAPSEFGCQRLVGVRCSDAEDPIRNRFRHSRSPGDTWYQHRPSVYHLGIEVHRTMPTKRVGRLDASLPILHCILPYRMSKRGTGRNVERSRLNQPPQSENLRPSIALQSTTRPPSHRFPKASSPARFHSLSDHSSDCVARSAPLGRLETHLALPLGDSTPLARRSQTFPFPLYSVQGFA